MANRAKKSSAYPVIIKPKAPFDTAEIFCGHHASKANKALVRYRNTWYQWTGASYRKLDTEQSAQNSGRFWPPLASGRNEPHQVKERTRS